jgi:biotin transport system permease protein
LRLTLYVPGATPLHRLPAGVKLIGLLAASVGLFVASNLVAATCAAVVAGALLASARPPLAGVRRQLGGAVVILAVVFLTNAIFETLPAALLALFRLLALLQLALAVTLTTRTSQMLEACEAALRPLDRLGVVDTAWISLAVALAVRFIPEVYNHWLEIREAQAARGLRGSPLALTVPLVVRTLRAADDVAAAIDARCFPPTQAALKREGGRDH